MKSEEPARVIFRFGSQREDPSALSELKSLGAIFSLSPRERVGVRGKRAATACAERPLTR